MKVRRGEEALERVSSDVGGLVDGKGGNSSLKLFVYFDIDRGPFQAERRGIDGALAVVLAVEFAVEKAA